MSELVSIDGRIVSAADASVSVFDRGFLYGDSVFEALRTYGGAPFALSEHLERLKRSAARVYIPLPVTDSQLRAEIAEVLAAANNPESYIRLMLTRGRGESLGLDPALANAPLRLILVTPLRASPDWYYERGIAVVTYRTQRMSDATSAAGAKLGNYLVAVLAMKEARAAGAEEALVTDLEGRIIEGSTSNVFAVERDCLVTPPEEAGILLGITRERVIALATELGIPIEYRSFTAEELVRADEAFICSTVREIVPVVSVDGRRIGQGVPGPRTTALLRTFRERAGA
jgi:branched-chain amino acid aminotransferase